MSIIALMATSSKLPVASFRYRAIKGMVDPSAVKVKTVSICLRLTPNSWAIFSYFSIASIIP